MKSRTSFGALALGAILLLTITPAQARGTHCDLSFHLEGWSAFYKTASGSGRVVCDNGQVRHVPLHAKGGGLTVGRSAISGRGDFSRVYDIREIYGDYANAEA